MVAQFVRERGFGLIVYAVLALAILGTLSGIAWKIRESGKDAIRVEWAEANRLAQEAADRLTAERALEARKAVIALQQAERKAADANSKWKALRRSQANAVLATCPSINPSVDKSATGAVASQQPDSGLRLTWAYVLLHDRAWVGKDGEPVFSGAGIPPGGAAETDPSPYGPGEILDNQGINAQRCSEDRRNYGALVDLIRKLQKQ